MKGPRNIVGPKIRNLRVQADLSQAALAARCAKWGWVLSRETLAKIESQIRWVSDFELVCLAKALKVTPVDLLPRPQEANRMLSDYFERLAKLES